MKRPLDLSRRFLDVADRDLRTLRILTAAPDSDDEVVGFHAQQAIEKCIKAALCVNEIAFRKTHDLAELIDLLRDNGQSLPPDTVSLEALNPYAVSLRYDLMDIEPAGLERERVLAIVAAVGAWAQREIELRDDRPRDANTSESTS